MQRGRSSAGDDRLVVLSGPIHDVPDIAEPVEVGRGGFATVYRATDLQAGRPVAVKLLSLRSDDGTLRGFDRERESLARLSTHPNVVTLHRTGVTTGGVPYLVMEYAPGGSLSDRLEANSPFPLAEAISWVLPVCRAVAHAHEQGVRHRDIKPQNILISAHGEPLLSDFGIAGLTAGDETSTQRARLSLSYASPEQIEGLELDDSTDVYSLGATLYTLIAGAPAFADVDGAGFLNTAKRIVEEPPPALDGSVPAGVADAIAAAMAKNPSFRPTIDEFRRALDRQITLVAPPPGDQLSAVTVETARLPDGPRATILASTPTQVVPGHDIPEAGGGTDGGGWLSSLVADAPMRTLTLAAVAALVVAGLLTAAWARRGTDSTAVADSTEVGIEPSAAGPEASEVDSDEDGADDGPVVNQPGATTSTILDRDDDGVVDSDDNCPDTANREQSNRDGDSLGDECDPDDDNDGVPDDRDNCRLDANAGQEDVDVDELGDACDEFPDRDGDGVIDTNDSCIELDDDRDTDGDGTPDKCDTSPRGMVVTAVSVQIDRVTILNTAYGDGEADLFGDLEVAGDTVGLPEINDLREIRPSNWSSGLVSIEPGAPLVQIRIWIRDEDDCFLCRDGLVDITPETGANALHLVVDTRTGVVDLASQSWNRLETIGVLSGPDDGDLTGTLTQSGDDDEVHLASIDVAVTLARDPAP